MKLILLRFILLTTLLVACSSTKIDKQLRVVKFDTSIHCANCSDKIFNKLPHAEGVTNLDVNIEKRTVTVTFDETKITVDKLAGLINDLGYSAKVIKGKDKE
ncbi:MAG: heavy-metal-associated domain-containing protein [Ignavibacteriae bacterium]|nr:heavy-metal-associated domain-containing protein [Ignavibacteriota bacterium]